MKRFQKTKEKRNAVMKRMLNVKFGFKLAMYAVCLALLVPMYAGQPASADSNARGRVIVANAPGATFKQVQTDTGFPLRGGPITVSRNAYCEPGQEPDATHTCSTNWAMDVNNWIKMKNMGINTGRITLFDFNNKAHKPNRPIWDIDDDNQLDTLLSKLDQVIDAAEEAGMYAVIDYHEVGSLHAAWLTKFWTAAAPRYANRTHVLYEMVNEPGNLTSTKLNQMANVYEIIRTNAPNTHVIHFSVQSMKNNLVPTVNDYKNRINNNTSVTLDFSAGNDSVGFHTYGTTSSNNIVTLRNTFPVICTEWGYAPQQTAVKALDGSMWHGQVLEQKQISWFDWNAGRKDDSFENQFQHRFLAHARQNNYAWTSEFFTGAFFNGFNGDTLDAVPAGWTTVSGSPVVRPNPSNANRSVRLTDGSSTTTTAMSKTISAQTHNVALSFRFMQPSKTAFEARLQDGSTVGPVFLTKGGTLKYRDSNGTETTIMNTYNANQWYNIVLSADVATDTYDIFVNGKLKKDDAEFNNTVTALDRIVFETGLTQTANVFIDAVRINNP